MTTIVEYKLRKVDTNIEAKKIKTSKDAAVFIRSFFEDLDVFESFYLITLNRSNMTTGYVRISYGGRAYTVVDTAIIANYAIKALASGVILCHNHPSGSLIVSQDDKAITTKVSQGLTLFDIKVLDHIILTPDTYLSMADENLM